MRKLYTAKVKLYYNLCKKGTITDLLINADTEEDVNSVIKKFYDDKIEHPKKVVYLYSKETDRYEPTVMDAGDGDERLIDIEIISVKDANLNCFWGHVDGNIYLCTLKGELSGGKMFVAFKENIVIGAKNFMDACEIIKTSFSQFSKVSRQLLSEKLLDATEGYTEVDYDVLSMKITKQIIIQDSSAFE